MLVSCECQGNLQQPNGTAGPGGLSSHTRKVLGALYQVSMNHKVNA